LTARIVEAGEAGLLGDLAHEGLVVLLQGLGRPGAEVAGVLGVVVADQHVDLEAQAR
jgi:hypothetical protein